MNIIPNDSNDGVATDALSRKQAEWPVSFPALLSALSAQIEASTVEQDINGIV